jgi:hypothetical protein
MKTHEQLIKELTDSMEGVSPVPGLPIEAFVEAAVALIESGRAMWDGKNLSLTQGSKQ